MRKFCKNWGVTQRISSSYHPQSNKRAELGVKSAKRLIRDNTGPSGSLNTNQFYQALLAHRNCLDSTSKVSPAQIVYGHSVRDLIPAINYTPREEWSTLARKREDCFLRRHYKKCEPLEANARDLQQILPGDNVFIQDQTGPTPKRWSKSGVIVESLPHDSFLVRIDGSRHISRRNRRFLRKFIPFGQQEEPTPHKLGSLAPTCHSPAVAIRSCFSTSPTKIW